MKIKIDRETESQLQKEIDKKWNEANANANEPCSLRAYSLTGYVSKLYSLFDSIGRNIKDYNGAKVRFKHTVEGGFDFKSNCLNFNLLIENGTFYLVELIYATVSSTIKHTNILLKPEYSVEEEKMNCKFKFGEVHGVKILLFGDTARLRFAHYPIELDYEIGSLKEFLKLIKEFTENLADNTRERLVVNLARNIRRSRISYYIP
jgi:hypothetical protein